MRFIGLFCYSSLLLLRCFRNCKAGTPLHWVPPPPEEWSNLEIGVKVKRFWELEWSKSTYLKECSEHVLQVVPVYFWTGERVDLPCHMCELAMAYNGKVKYWAKVDDITEFLKAPQLNVISRKDLYRIIRNDEEVDDVMNSNAPSKSTHFDMPRLAVGSNGATIQMPSPVYLQRDGKLSIIRVKRQSVSICPVHNSNFYCIKNVPKTKACTELSFP